MKWSIWDHSVFPGPDYWDFKCLECGELVKDHAPWPLVVLKKIFGKCEHKNVRCVHGDEINLRNAVAACVDCGKSLKRQGRPMTCTVTGKLHGSEL
jgi:hypothetical protein